MILENMRRAAGLALLAARATVGNGLAGRTGGRGARVVPGATTCCAAVCGPVRASGGTTLPTRATAGSMGTVVVGGGTEGAGLGRRVAGIFHAVGLRGPPGAAGFAAPTPGAAERFDGLPGRPGQPGRDLRPLPDGAPVVAGAEDESVAAGVAVAAGASSVVPSAVSYTQL
ncbi:hypothetical protein JTF08_17810, partial [Micrococcaceae bacterium RIT802]|nr:hypothetical protein [Micrococcaceae bacterium RIT 802]